MNKKPRKLPFYGTPGLKNSLITSSRINNISIPILIIRKITNLILLSIAYSCPFNEVRIWCHKKRGVAIGQGVFIGLQVIIDRAYPHYITLEDHVMIAGGNHLLAHSRAPEYYKGKLLSYVAPITIKKYAWLGINSIILPNVTVGEGTVVTAGSVVTDNLPSGVIARGNPAQIIREL